MTVMFCDIVGSTRISETLDPEQTREILLKFQDVAAAPVRRYDGFIAQYLGDGLLVYFGYPRAHEDAARRALLAGLEVAEAVRALSPEIEARFHVALEVRVGVHTGEVVVGDMRGGGTGAIGPTPNVAARLQEVARPNTVVTSAFTRGLTEGYFEFEDLGPHDLKGVAEKMPLFCVLRLTGASSRLETTSVLAPLVGRQAEQQLLEDRWTRARQNDVVKPLLVLGEAGLGKSRLVRLAQALAGSTGGITIEGHCSPYNIDTPFYAIAQLIERGCGIFTDDSAEVRLSKLESQLAYYEMPLDAAAVLAPLLSIPPTGRYQPLMLSPEAFRALVIETLDQWLSRVAQKGVVLLLVEDLHWADDSTLGLLARLMSNTERSRCLILVTSRTEPTHQAWPRDSLDVLALTPLDAQACLELLDWLLPGRGLPGELSEELLARSNGNPLFIEELARTYRSDNAAPGRIVPRGIRDLLTARLEAPGVDKGLAQVIATIGIEAPLTLLSAVSGYDRRALEQQLEGLIAAGILERSLGTATESCSFRHALVRETAYESQLMTQRVAVHGSIVDAMEQGAGGAVRPEVLGLHCLQAERWASAATYYVQAGTHARSSGAEAEAIRHFTEALRAVEALPEGPQRDGLELLARVSRVGSYTATIGYAAPASLSDVEACSALCQGFGPSPELLAALTSIWAFHMAAGNLGRALTVYEQARAVVEAPELQCFLPEVHIYLGHHLYAEGRFSEAIDILGEAAIAYRARIDSGGPSFFPLPNDPGVAALALKACALWNVGLHDAAIRCVDDALEAAGKLQFPEGPFSVGYAGSYGAWMCYVAGDCEAAQAYANRVLEVGQQYGFGLWQLVGAARFLECAALLGPPEGVEVTAASLKETVDVWRGTGAEFFQTCNLTSLAMVYRTAGFLDRALECLESALTELSERGERIHEAEILRLHAELRLETGAARPEEVATELVNAVEVAKSQGARSFQVRAAATLVRLQPQTAGARSLLAEAVEAFPPETQWSELDAAKALLVS